jgi:hypothetical protein
MGFVCSVCGEVHAARMLDIRMELPDPIYELPDGERERRTWLADDFAVLDDSRFFVRGLLEIPIPELRENFGYGVWAEIEQEQFTHLLERWGNPDQFDPFEAALANELTPYAGTAGLRAELRPVSVDKLPTIRLLETEHELVADQRRGISVRRSDELAALAQHE